MDKRGCVSASESVDPRPYGILRVGETSVNPFIRPATAHTFYVHVILVSLLV